MFKCMLEVMNVCILMYDYILYKHTLRKKKMFILYRIWLYKHKTTCIEVLKLLAVLHNTRTPEHYAFNDQA